MKVLVLVISSDTFPVYAHHREVWRRYRALHPEFECYFLEYRPLVFVPTLTSDTLVLPGIERYDTILTKTLDAIDYFARRRSYDYVLRTNLSSVWDFVNLRRYLETIPRERVYQGQCGVNSDTGIQFASGAGILMSADVVRALLTHRRVALTLPSLDDVAIAKALASAGFTPSPLPRVDFVSLAHYSEHHTKIPEGSFHYRVKNLANRMEEPVVMRRLLQEHILPT